MIRAKREGRTILVRSRSNRAIANTARFTGLSIDAAVPMASTIQASSLSMAAVGGVIADWEPAQSELHIRRVVD